MEELEKDENIEELENIESDDSQQNIEEQIQEKPKKKKKKIGRIIANVLVTILFLVIIIEAAIGIINMQRINDDKEAIWYISKKDNSNEVKNEVIYNLGLYKIVRTDTSKRTKIALKPFFVGD